ncbi:MAG: beta-Ala-His dipeptidase [Candidatus Bipolaricaulota bacterium]
MLNLEPSRVWRYFEEVSEVPRCSGKEEKVMEYILEVAENNDLRTKVDEAGNVLLSGSEQGETPFTVLQAHMDMVCEKNSDVDHDFDIDPIKLTREDGWITARGTTLGADNGIGVAIALAVITGDHHLGPLDCLFTVDEERGLNGAAELDPTFVRGNRLINLDSEEFGSFTIGCAGGGKTRISLPVNFIERDSGDLLKLSISGLAGGHSGADIDRGRANANKLLARLLDEQAKEFDFSLVDIRGGDKHNSIPREAITVLEFDGNRSDFRESLRERFSVFLEEYRDIEPNMELGIEKTGQGKYERKMAEESSHGILNLIRALPNGVMAYDRRLESTVETSTNLASVRIQSGQAKIMMSSRSSRETKLVSLRRRIELIARSFGAEVEQLEAYPAWQPDRDSELLSCAETVFEDLCERSPEIKTIHGGLETGIIGEKVKGVDMIAMGPDIEFPHSPDERLRIESVQKFWEFLLELLTALTVRMEK